MKSVRIVLSILGFALITLLPLTSPDAVAKKVSVAGGSIGGTYYVLVTGFSKILTEDVGLAASVEVTGGAVHNTKLVDAGKAEFALVNGGAFNPGLTGTGWAKGKKYQNCRVLFGVMSSYLHFWTPKKTGIKSINDLNGKIVNLSKKGSGADIDGRAIFKMFGIKPAKITNVGHTQANSLMQDGLAHASLTAGGIPHPAVAALSTTIPVRQVGLVGMQADAYQKAKPFMTKGAIPTGTYKGQDVPVATLKDWNMMIVNKDMPDDLVYKVVKATFANVAKWAAVHKAARTTKPENIKDLKQYPIHPGAMRYYKEKGLL